MSKHQILIFLSILLTNIVFIQNIKGQGELPTPGELFDAKNYIQALEQFKKYEKEYPDDYELKHQIDRVITKRAKELNGD